ncbi:MAG: hypothetical protein PVSMB1_07970 [Gemmatimonadaceae bacterium]
MHAQANSVKLGASGIKPGRAAIAGVIGGIVMAMVAMMVTATLGMGLWAMPAMIAGLILGPQAAMSGGLGVIGTGLALHMMLSAIFGVVLGIVVNKATHEFVFTGAAVGLALWIVNFYLVGALWQPATLMAQHEPAWLAAMTHLVFGLATGYTARRLSS